MPEVGEETLHEYFMVLSVGVLVIFTYMCPLEKLNAKFREQILKHIGYTHSFFVKKWELFLLIYVLVFQCLQQWRDGENKIYE